MNQRLKAFLDARSVRYVCLHHSPAFSAAEVAASAHVAGRDFAKTIILQIGDEFAMLVLPATRRVLLPELRELLMSDDVKLASEEKMRRLFPDCELGAMPPFGNLYGLRVHVDAALTDEPEIAFNAGTHTDVVKMAYADFEQLVHPSIIDYVTT